jgi:hypothetical protein
VLVPYHKARSGYLYKHRINLLPLGESTLPWAEGVGFTVEDRIKLTYHMDGFAHFSSENPGKVISGRDPQTGEQHRREGLVAGRQTDRLRDLEAGGGSRGNMDYSSR